MSSPPQYSEPSIEFPERSRDEPPLPPPPVPASPPRRERRAKYLILFLLTCITTTLAGAGYYASFILDFGAGRNLPSLPFILINGLWFAVPALLILGAHEFGHYFACRYYGVESSLPYFLPFWLPFYIPQFGTFGAVIRIRQPIRFKRQLFDIGIAGPLAGFAVIVPVLLIGLSLSRVVRMPADFSGIDLGEPLLFRACTRLLFGAVPEGYALNVHPMGWAAWFGLLATALNLAPIGQLDGGHISYAVLGRKSVVITVLAALALVVLTVVSGGSYALWTVLIVVMLLLLGPHHPRVVDEDAPLDRTRLWLAALAAVILLLSFTPIILRQWTPGS